MLKNFDVINPRFENPRVRQVSIWRVDTEGGIQTNDTLAAEEPLEIVLAFGRNNQRKRQSISITMRTPTGHDFELALGFLWTEGVISVASDVLSVRYSASELDKSAQTNVVQVDLHPSVKFDSERLNRHFYTSSSCGVCGKTSIDMVEATSCFFIPCGKPVVQKEILFDLPDKLRAAQSVFDITGAIHAAALFDTEGVLVALREDVGRHNALDKLIGWAMQNGKLPLNDTILLVSGRTSFELVQKAMMAGIPIIAAVGAPSSLAVELADDFGMTLIGFLRQRRFNVYAGSERIENLKQD
ncbi:MAG: formate dehydrogenase accessory sulfurtransferase FdhD [Saprospiraceae bacterium]|nr:formate dehydrogenase accessory sulfurtransferase FdhD [Saprospiraceae bacterium]